MEPWQRQFIRYLFPYSASRLNIEAAFMVKHPHVPNYLYKFREFKKAHLDALERGVLFMSSPDKFNDPFDSTVFFDPSRFIVEDRPLEEFLAEVRELERAKTSQESYRPKPITKPIRQDEWMRRMAAEVLKDEPEDLRNAVMSVIAERDAKEGVTMRKIMSDWFRRGFGVLSFAGDPTSILMWSHYANAHKGFCIEYDFRGLEPDDPRRRMCFPVFYRAKKTDATRYLADTGAQNFNNLFGQFLCLLKHSSWAYEKEWRIVYAIGPDHANFEMPMPAPSAIIVGSEAEQDDVAWMESYCNRNSIRLKRTVRSDKSAEILLQ